MRRTIENATLLVEIADDGAELSRIYDKVNDREIIWNGDAAYWGRHAPVLFPNVGKNFANKYIHQGTEYATKQHGFARDTAFSCAAQTGYSVTHEMKSTEETRKYFPFDFLLRITHTLEENRLLVSWKVVNTGKEEMHFTIGGHPAFQFENIEDTKDWYKLKFPGKEALAYRLLDTETGTAREKLYELKLEKESCALSDEMFEKDALIFDGGQISDVILCRKDGTALVEMTCPGFPNFGIWSVQGAPFVCLEPWIGRCDDYGFAGEISTKPGIISLIASEVFEKSYTIKIW